MSSGAVIDLSKLPPPNAVEALDFETILAEAKATVIDLYPELAPVLALESETTVKLLQALAYRELLVRNRVNQGVRAVMPALAVGADLDHLAAVVGLARLEITPADPETGAPAVMEDDEAFRRRMVLAPVGFSVAGPADAYVFHALSAHPDVLDASASSPAPGEVVVTVLDRDGAADPEVLAAVEARVNADEVRPMTDLVTVQGAEELPFEVKGDLEFWPGPDPSVVLIEARSRLSAYLSEARGLGRGATRASLIAALHAEGVRNVALAEPAADVPAEAVQSAACRLIRLNGEYAPGTIAALAAMSSAPAAGRATAIDNLIARLEVKGVWPSLRALWVLAAHHEQAARINLRAPGVNDLVAVNSPAFAVDGGFTGNGTTSWLETGLSPADVAGPAGYGISAGAWFGDNPSPGTSQFPLGVTNGDETLSMAISPSTFSFSARVGNTNLAAFGSAPNAIGHFAVSRTSSTHVRGFHNGALVGEVASPFVTYGGGTNIGILRRLAAYHSGTLKTAWLGVGLTDAQILELHAALAAYLAELAP